MPAGTIVGGTNRVGQDLRPEHYDHHLRLGSKLAKKSGET
jgi:hypothetical protein